VTSASDDAGQLADPAGAPRRHRLPGKVAFAVLGGILVLLLDAWLVYLHAAGPDRTSSPVVAAVPVATVGPVATTAPAPSIAGPPTPAPTPTRARVAPFWVNDIAARTGIPARALTAYANAELATDATRPGCHMSWALLAGIGWVESRHGSFGGSVLQADGTASPPILGPALDGTHGMAAIPATAAGVRLDGDPKWDHAIGPMQFIPSTWTHWAVAADGGVPNPNDIDDAALTAAGYLCAAGGDVATPAGWQAAIAAYNAPTAYAVQVTTQANTYAQQSQT
jgi:membrane-bound lytic murein transglycosylase B